MSASEPSSLLANAQFEIEDEGTKVDLEKNPWEVSFPPTLAQIQKLSQNYIRTTKYTLLSFFPLNVYYQYRRFYNTYFLIAAISVLVGSVIGFDSSLSPTTQVLPLVVVFMFSAGKEAVEDHQRYVADRDANNVECTVIRNGIQMSIKSMNIVPGDIIFVQKGEKVPVDAIILSTNYDDGTCFVETADLDGETNLKRRVAPLEFASLNTDEKVSLLAGKIQCEHPNINLEVFTGRCIVTQGITPQTIPINMTNLLLRGVVIRNTDHAYAMVVYTGRNTKIIKNLRKVDQKTSDLERQLNYLTLSAFVINAWLLISSIILDYSYYNTTLNTELAKQAAGDANYIVNWYIGAQSTSRTSKILSSVFAFFALYTYVIPISLFVTLEMTRLFQGRFMMWDHKMRIFQPQPNGKMRKMRMQANNTNLNEELGRVDYVLSDKTGTLTQNNMKSSKWYIDGKIYDEMAEPGCLLNALRSEPNPKIALFTHTLSLCHSVIPALDEVTHQLVYESQSPDETALLNSMRNNGSKLVSRIKGFLSVEFLYPRSGHVQDPIVEQHLQLAMLEFSSDRKRMSLIARAPNGKIYLYSKGADNIMLARLKKDAHSQDMINHINSALYDFSVIGLRTLVVAYREFTEEEWKFHAERLEQAEKSLTNREGKIAAVAEEIERDLIFVGCTAIEDRLQEQVPETIDFMLQMGIKVWCLTGDKRETAINIGMSSKLINSDMNLIVLEGKSLQRCSENIERNLTLLAQKTEKKMNALVVDGETLEFALNGELELKFLSIATQCHSVICCRVSPLQKSKVVQLVRTRLKCNTLAIGDGANDVSMIQAANIGVGIQGREGSQAVRAADYSFAEFRFLKRLLAVHGRYSYYRMASLILYSFYKNLTMIIVQWYFGFLNLWSGQVVYEQIFMTAYNIIFTSLPPFVVAVFDRDLPEKEIEEIPQLYKQVKQGVYWNWKRIAWYLFSALWHSFAIFGCVYMVNYEGNISWSGQTSGYWIQCYLLGTPLLITVMLKIALETRYWVWLSYSSIALSILSNIIVMFILEPMNYVEVGTPEIANIIAAYYFLSLFVPVLCCIPDVALLYVTRYIWPSDADIVLEQNKLNRQKVGAEDMIPMRSLNSV